MLSVPKSTEDNGRICYLENDFESGVATIRIERLLMNAISMRLASQLLEILKLSNNQDVGAVVFGVAQKYSLQEQI